MSDERALRGLIKIRDHCLFTWEASADLPDRKRIVVMPEHCTPCIAELKRTFGAALSLVFSAGDGTPRKR